MFWSSKGPQPTYEALLDHYGRPAIAPTVRPPANSAAPQKGKAGTEEKTKVAVAIGATGTHASQRAGELLAVTKDRDVDVVFASSGSAIGAVSYLAGLSYDWTRAMNAGAPLQSFARSAHAIGDWIQEWADWAGAGTFGDYRRDPANASAFLPAQSHRLNIGLNVWETRREYPRVDPDLLADPEANVKIFRRMLLHDAPQQRVRQLFLPNDWAELYPHLDERSIDAMKIGEAVADSCRSFPRLSWRVTQDPTKKRAPFRIIGDGATMFSVPHPYIGGSDPGAPILAWRHHEAGPLLRAKQRSDDSWADPWAGHARRLPARVTDNGKPFRPLDFLRIGEAERDSMLLFGCHLGETTLRVEHDSYLEHRSNVALHADANGNVPARLQLHLQRDLLRLASPDSLPLSQPGRSLGF